MPTFHPMIWYLSFTHTFVIYTHIYSVCGHCKSSNVHKLRNSDHDLFNKLAFEYDDEYNYGFVNGLRPADIVHSISCAVLCPIPTQTYPLLYLQCRNTTLVRPSPRDSPPLLPTLTSQNLPCFFFPAKGTEWTCTKRRMLAGIITDYAFGLGYMLLAGIAYLIRDWRKLQLAISAPGFLLIFYIWWGEKKSSLHLNIQFTVVFLHLWPPPSTFHPFPPPCLPSVSLSGCFLSRPDGCWPMTGGRKP